MEPIIDIPLKKELQDQFNKNKGLVKNNDTKFISELRDEAMDHFIKTGFPHQGLEKWRNTNISKALLQKYHFPLEPIDQKINIDDIFRCEVPDLNTFVVTQYNGWYIPDNGGMIRELEDGTLIGSLAEAKKRYPELVDNYYAKSASLNGDGLHALNTAFAQDGIFVYIPDNVAVDTTIQIVNLIDSNHNLFVQPRNLIILGKNSKLRLVHCDHSLKHKVSFINSLSEVYVGENANFDHYKLQNKDNSSSLITNVYIHQEANSKVKTNTITLNGGIVRNETHVKLSGQNASADILGLYLVDKTQHVDNQVYVGHAVPNCYSNELFKGIIDDEASAVFNGHILVEKNAQQTNAYQNNKNILLTDKAKIDTKPFLEIYADDVKCSHGATVGQLDPEAMFYFRSRGISYHNARMLLMYAFAHEVIGNISIEALKKRIDNMVEKRLKGELSVCDQCVLNCSENSPVTFNIDISKI